MKEIVIQNLQLGRVDDMNLLQEGEAEKVTRRNSLHDGRLDLNVADSTETGHGGDAVDRSA
jgi:hypothetical protein